MKCKTIMGPQSCSILGQFLGRLAPGPFWVVDLAVRAFVEVVSLNSSSPPLRRLGAAVARASVYAPASRRARFAALSAASRLTLVEARALTCCSACQVHPLRGGP